MYRNLLLVLFVVLIFTGTAHSKKKPDDQLVLVYDAPEYIDLTVKQTSIINQLNASFVELLEASLFLKNQDFRIYKKNRFESLSSFALKKFGSKELYLLHISTAFKPYSDNRIVAFGRRRMYKKQDGFLNVEISLNLYKLRSNKLTLTREINLRIDSDRQWARRYNYKATNSFYRKAEGSAEPYDFVLQRVIDSAFNFIKEIPQKEIRINNQIKLTLFVDSSYITRNSENWEEEIDQTFRLTSLSFYNQFGVGFELPDKKNEISMESNFDLGAVYRQFKAESINSSDNLRVLFYSGTNPEELLFEDKFDPIGYSELGQKVIVISDITEWFYNQPFWKPKYISLTLLHEIGHGYGGIHVSDINSVMNHNQTDFITANFDPVNRQIINDALSGKISFKGRIDYIKYMSQLLQQTSYKLVDLPQLFYSFIKEVESESEMNRIFETISYQPYIDALRGYLYFLDGDAKSARKLFSQAIESDPNQASFYFYLSLSGNGLESQKALKRASEMGYYQAQLTINK